MPTVLWWKPPPSVPALIPPLLWFPTMPLKHIHLNDNDGVYDLHGYLSSGNLDYKYVLDKVNEIGNDKEITILLEMNKYEDVVKSLSIIGGGGYGSK